MNQRSRTTVINRELAVLLLVDIQVDFVPGGALAVAGGDAIVAPIRALLASGIFAHVVATQDWHPPDHVSFASRHTGRQPLERISLYGREQVLWPDHCVAGTPGALLHAGLPSERIQAIIRKGMDRTVDSYSGFRNNWNEHNRRPPTGLRGYLEECGLIDVYVCGLARDYCVKWTAEDAADLGFKTSVIWDLTRAVDASNDGPVRAALLDKGVRILDAAAVF
ncbi:MAG TPA: bifunctional nicotinamidase/pyrazinamidase [Gammaproteobacteria bacterium]|nr:bifunctional nicotinamidase/pyrazinamidase [Gammaproteobacteria bacterium]